MVEIKVIQLKTIANRDDMKQSRRKEEEFLLKPLHSLYIATFFFIKLSKYFEIKQPNLIN